MEHAQARRQAAHFTEVRGITPARRSHRPAGHLAERAEEIKGAAGADLVDLANDRIIDLADGALDAGLFGIDDR